MRMVLQCKLILPAAMENSENTSKDICGIGFLNSFNGDTDVVCPKRPPGLVSYETVVG